jgi:hypothetical protein
MLIGDTVGERRVAGFAWVGTRGESTTTHVDDRLLLDGDQRLRLPPNRLVPQTTDDGNPSAVMPPDDLPPAQVHAAADVDPVIPLRVDALLDLPGAPWQPLIRPLLAAVHATGHRAWLAGGAVRDVLSGVPLDQVNDLDLTGTAPPGRFTDIAYQTLRASRMAEYRTTVNPDSLVCAVVPPRSNARLIEYRGLSQGGFSFPAVGSRLAEDAAHRDFSFNALLYDMLDHTVLDGCGTGLVDLVGPTRRFTPMTGTGDLMGTAMILLRSAKFALRWSDVPAVDLEPLRTWAAGLPEDLCRSLTSGQKRTLTSLYRENVRGDLSEQRRFAAALPGAGRELIELLIGRTS